MSGERELRILRWLVGGEAIRMTGYPDIILSRANTAMPSSTSDIDCHRKPYDLFAFLFRE